MAELAVQDVSFRYRGKYVLKDVSFTIESGTFCALLGANGAGKSTLMSLLCHLGNPSAGSISVNGLGLAEAPLAALAQMGIVFQQPTLDLDTTVRNNLSYFASLHGLRGNRARDSIAKALDRMDMSERADEKVRALNGGHRRRMEIARALIHDPGILLLDEPTVGLDPQARHAITDHAHRLAEDGVAVLWATHLVDEVRDDDQVVVLHQGRILAQGTAREMAMDKPLGERFLDLTDAAEARQ